ncbi:Secondary metabolism regulator laeA [Colletotrichum orbiculare MAFF 240422]|uniref:Secondary metabolism regulator laeA n=1 Tax=Colletotrichum orbiculare (strain 104-T / ATCC 96160 / CBS 514.97 / LARS 414 / MAFF 240422) TaxID=1213857 RepID=N4UNJ5_COLOR|nr:Secondary metabolism regulator laeA [Colletotrichum orbiculare MAFF 240422]
MDTDDSASEMEMDVDQSDLDSALGDDSASIRSLSLKSVAEEYEWKFGRRYHGFQPGTYSFPNDDLEQVRLEMIHHVFYRLLNDRLYLAPITTAGLKVLDIGTGTGEWAIQFADEHPEAALVVRNDLSPIQPSWSPANVRFMIDDVEMDWVEPQNYGYIHCRYMAGAIRDWTRLISQVFDNLEPGGWFEFQESENTLHSEDGTLSPDSPMVEMMEGLIKACDLLGRTMNPAPFMGRLLANIGFENVQEYRCKLPIGDWHQDPRLKEIGRLMAVNFVEGVEAFTASLFGDVLGWPQEDVKELNRDVVDAVERRDTHAMFDFVVVVGQKPNTAFS